MNKQDRVKLIKDFFRLVNGEVRGRKKIHKLFFLYQAKGMNLGQDFIFHHYGVYSPSLGADLQQAQEWGLIEEDLVGNTYIIRLKESKEEDTGSSLKEYENFIQLLAGKPAQLLEVLSTLVYLQQEGFKDGVLFNKLNELKGHLEFYFEEAFKLAEEVYGINKEK